MGGRQRFTSSRCQSAAALTHVSSQNQKKKQCRHTVRFESSPQLQLFLREDEGA